MLDSVTCSNFVSIMRTVHTTAKTTWARLIAVQLLASNYPATGISDDVHCIAGLFHCPQRLPNENYNKNKQ